MNYPIISEYIEAIKSAEENFDELKHLRPVLDEDGEPMMSGGNFAVVFKMKDEQTGKLHAVKCFLREQEGRAEAYRQIAEELEYVSSTFLTPIKYMDKELFVDTGQSDETEFPVLLMDWVEGQTLDKYIREHIDDQYELSLLAYQFSRLAMWLMPQPFAHGDLKPDNILVKEDGTLVLVDYDGMYVPAMKGQKARELGSPDFRHPLRTEDDFDEHIDDFSLASIMLLIEVLIVDKKLLNNSGNNECVLFHEMDYKDIAHSKINQEVLSLCITNRRLANVYSLFLMTFARRKITQEALNAVLDTSIEEVDKVIQWKQAKKKCNGGDSPDSDLKMALNIFKDLSKKQYVDAQICYSCCLRNGYGCTPDVKQGIEMLQSIAIQGNSRAQYSFGICYYNGEGVEKDYTKAFEWYQKAAEQGDSDGQWRLGYCYYFGEGVGQDYAKAVEWYQKAAEQGNSDGQWRLGNRYYFGEGVEQDYTKAVEWYQKAAEQGDPDGQLRLGDCYYNGKGVEQDYTKAVEWYQKSAEQGYLKAKKRLEKLSKTEH